MRLVLLILSGLALIVPASTGADSERPRKTAAIVDHVADGDTIQVEIRGREEDIRFIGIDTPEVYGGTECGGPEASAAMKRMIGPGDRVKLVRDRTQDNRDYYGRLLRYVEFKGRDLGQRQLRKGWAKVYVFEDPFKRLRPYRRAQKSAKQADRGVWKECGGF